MGTLYYYNRKLKQTCFMCDEIATTGDHIPPKGLFPTSLRNECKFLIVPACKKHNNESKLDDEYFRTVVAIASPHDETAEKLISERIFKALEKGKIGLIKYLQNIAQPILLKNPDGTIEEGMKFEIDKPRFQRIAEKLAKGLFWHHNGIRLPDTYKVNPYLWNYSFTEEQKRVLCELPIRYVGHPKVFEYRYGEVENDPHKLFIAMSFFGASNLLEVLTIPSNQERGSLTSETSAKR